MNALLVIDMQISWFETPRHDKDGVITRVNQLIDAMRQSGGSVVFIRHADADAMPDSPGFQIEPSLHYQPDDIIFDKTACDSFADTALLPWLQQLGMQNLYLCGLATEFCVDTTLRAALSRGFNVVALSDAHTTANRPHLKAIQIIEHHNWVWANMTAPMGRSLRVCNTAQALLDLA